MKQFNSKIALCAAAIVFVVGCGGSGGGSKSANTPNGQVDVNLDENCTYSICKNLWASDHDEGTFVFNVKADSVSVSFVCFNGLTATVSSPSILTAGTLQVLKSKESTVRRGSDTCMVRTFAATVSYSVTAGTLNLDGDIMYKY